MKSYEETAREVLRRRDEYLKIKKRRKKIALSVAASFCCAIAAAAVFRLAGPNVIKAPSPSDGKDKDAVAHRVVIEFDGAYYEIIDPHLKDFISDGRETLKKYGLPAKITGGDVGEFVSYACVDGQPARDERGKKIGLYKYNIQTKNKQSAVYVAKDSAGYKFALFCNYYGASSGAPESASSLLSLYGIKEAGDIAKIELSQAAKPHKRIKILKSEKDVRRFFDALVSSRAENEDEFQNVVFGSLNSEEKREELAVKLADESVAIRIVTKDGLVINHMDYSPTAARIAWTVYHYKLTGAPY